MTPVDSAAPPCSNSRRSRSNTGRCGRCASSDLKIAAGEQVATDRPRSASGRSASSTSSPARACPTPGSSASSAGRPPTIADSADWLVDARSVRHRQRSGGAPRQRCPSSRIWRCRSRWRSSRRRPRSANRRSRSRARSGSRTAPGTGRSPSLSPVDRVRVRLARALALNPPILAARTSVGDRLARRRARRSAATFARSLSGGASQRSLDDGQRVCGGGGARILTLEPATGRLTEGRLR